MSILVSSDTVRSLARFSPISDIAASFAAACALAELESSAVAAASAEFYLEVIGWSGDLDWADETFRFLNLVEPPPGVIMFEPFWEPWPEESTRLLLLSGACCFLSLGLTNLQLRLFMIDSFRSWVQKKFTFSGSSFSWKSHQKRFLNKARTII